MFANVVDSLQNLAANLGGGRAKTAGDAFVMASVNQANLAAMYRSDWMARKIVDMPVQDMLRPWRAWETDASQVATIEAQEKRFDVRARVGKAMRAARLYGGAGILIGADSAKPSEPLDVTTVKRGGLQHLTVLPCYQLQATEIETDPYSPHYGLPRAYTLASARGGSIQIHPSRVIRFEGADSLDFEQNGTGWPDSHLLSVYDAIHHAALTSAGIAELVHEAKIDVISIPNLGSQLGTEAGTQMLTKRFQTANALKSINNMLLLDDKEKWDRKQTSFAGLTDVLDRYLQIVAGAADIPSTRLLGTSAKGLGSTGEHDTRNYYDMLAGVRADKIDAAMQRLDAVLWQDAGGSVPTDAYYEWRPLWQPTDKERADVAKVKADTTKIYSDMGLLPDDVLARGVANQLIEDAVYPGIEDDLAAVQSASNGALADPAENDPTPAG